MLKDDRFKALNVVKFPVKAYAKDPPDGNAVKVRPAWDMGTEIQATSIWRH